MRSSRADDRSGRESVFTRPAHLDDLVDRINAGESFAENEEEDGESGGGSRKSRYSRYAGTRSERSSSGGEDDRGGRYNDRHGDSRRSSGMGGAMFEELEREVTVMRTQNGFLEKQLA
eukprot:6349627-Prymnesium_polylepis.1